MMWNGLQKALTFSYDDGVTQDRRLVRLFDQYGLKATFNLNAGRFGLREQISSLSHTVDHSTIDASEVRDLYRCHEVASHTLTHPMLPNLSESEILREIGEDCKKLESLCGYPISGMAYPGGGVNHDSRVMEVIRQGLPGIRYARTITSTYSFQIPGDLLELNPTVYHMEMDKMEALADAFIELKPDRPSLFYIWGHSYELDAAENDAFWTRFEQVCKKLASRKDIFYGTNREVLLGMAEPNRSIVRQNN